MAKIQGATAGLGSALDRVGTGTQLAGFRASAALTAPIVAGFTSLISEAKKWEEAANRFKSTTLLSDKDVAKHKKFAQIIGATSPFGNTEVLNAQTFLAQSGLESEKIAKLIDGQVKGAINPVLELAAAGEMAAEEVARLSTNVLLAMGLPKATATEAEASLRKIGDVLAWVAGKKDTTVAEVFTSLRDGAPVAKAVGMEVEQLTSIMGVLADGGFRGARAGVALKSILISLANPTKKAAAILEGIDYRRFLESGFKITGGGLLDHLVTQNSISSKAAASLSSQVDALISDTTKTMSKRLEGVRGLIHDSLKLSPQDMEVVRDQLMQYADQSIKGMDVIGIFKALQGSGAGIAEVGRLFGKHHSAKAQVLLDNIQSVIDQEEDIRRNADGSLKKKADAITKGLPGALQRLEASYQTFMTTVSDGGAGKVITDMIDSMRDLFRLGSQTSDSILKNIVVWGAVAAAIGPVLIYTGLAIQSLGVIGGLISKVSKLALLAAGGLRILAMGFASIPIVAAGAAIAAMVGVIRSNLSGVSVELDTLGQATSWMFSLAGDALAAWITGQDEDLKKSLTKMAALWETIKSAGATVAANVGEGILKGIFGEKLFSHARDYLAIISKNISGLFDSIGAAVSGALDGLGFTGIDSLKQSMGDLADTLRMSSVEFLDWVADITSLGDTAEMFRAAGKSVGEFARAIGDSAFATGREVFADLRGVFGDLLSTATDLFRKAVPEIRAFARAIRDPIFSAGQRIFQGLALAIENVYKALMDVGNQQAALGSLGDSISAVTSAWQGAPKGIQDATKWAAVAAGVALLAGRFKVLGRAVTGLGGLLASPARAIGGLIAKFRNFMASTRTLSSVLRGALVTALAAVARVASRILFSPKAMGIYLLTEAIIALGSEWDKVAPKLEKGFDDLLNSWRDQDYSGIGDALSDIGDAVLPALKKAFTDPGTLALIGAGVAWNVAGGLIKALPRAMRAPGRVAAFAFARSWAAVTGAIRLGGWILSGAAAAGPAILKAGAALGAKLVAGFRAAATTFQFAAWIGGKLLKAGWPKLGAAAGALWSAGFKGAMAAATFLGGIGGKLLKAGWARFGALAGALWAGGFKAVEAITTLSAGMIGKINAGKWAAAGAAVGAKWGKALIRAIPGAALLLYLFGSAEVSDEVDPELFKKLEKRREEREKWFKDNIGSPVQWFEMDGAVFENLGTKVEALSDKMRSLVPPALEKWEAFKEFHVNLWDGLTGGVDKAITEAKKFLPTELKFWWIGFRETMVDLWGKVSGGVTSAYDKVMEFVPTGLRAAWETFESFMTGLWGRITGAIDAAAAAIRGIASAIGSIKAPAIPSGPGRIKDGAPVKKMSLDAANSNVPLQNASFQPHINDRYNAPPMKTYAEQGVTSSSPLSGGTNEMKVELASIRDLLQSGNVKSTLDGQADIRIAVNAKGASVTGTSVSKGNVKAKLDVGVPDIAV